MKLNAPRFTALPLMALALFLGACSKSEPQPEQKPEAPTPPPAPVVEQKAEVTPAPAAPKPAKKTAAAKKPAKEAVVKKASAPKTVSPQEASVKLPSTGEVVMPSGLKYQDLVQGSGERIQSGQTASMHYTGYLTNGNKFDSSKDRGTPFVFKLGMGQVIEGWEKGVPGMKVGGKRRLTIPPELGYGARGAGSVIPPNATLIFEVDLLEINP